MKALPKTAYLQLTHVYAYTYTNAYMRWKGTTLVDLKVTFFWSMCVVEYDPNHYKLQLLMHIQILASPDLITNSILRAKEWTQEFM